MNILETSIERMGDLAAESSRMLDELEKINTSTAQTIDIVTDQTDRTNQSAEKINEAVVAIAEENVASTQETSASMNTLTEKYRPLQG